MSIEPRRSPAAAVAAAAVTAVALLGACTTPPRQQVAESPPRQAQPFDDAMSDLAVALFSRARIDPTEQRVLVVDPPVDAATVGNVAATRAVEQRILDVAGRRFPNMQQAGRVNEAALERRPVMLLSCLSPVAAPGSTRTAVQPPHDVYRIWASLSDLRTGKIVSQETVWVRAEDVDVTPTPFFRDSPAWTMDHGKVAYLKVCGGKTGETMDPAYLAGLRASIAANEGIRAYEGGRYPEALALYTQARQLPGGDRVRVLNGIYLTSIALGRPQQAEQAFGELVDAGLEQGKLSVKFVFRPASTQFWPDPVVSGQYPTWLRQIAQRSAARDTCLLVVGHTSPTGAPALNEVLSERRAAVVRSQLVRRVPALEERTEVRGRGSREPLIGTGRDDATDVLDRRVEFEPRACDTVRAEQNPVRAPDPRRG